MRPPARPAPSAVTLLRLLAWLPLPLLYAVSGAGGWLVFDVFRYRRTVTDENLAGAVPTLDPAARRDLRRGYERQLTQVVAEVLKGGAMTRDALVSRVALEGLDAVEASLAAGRSVLIATGHCANWEWLLLAVSARLSAPLTALYKPIRGASLEAYFKALRSRFGAALVPAKDVAGALARPAAGARAFALVADQVPSSTPHRVWTRFLGRDTAFYQGVDDLARAGGFVVYTVFAERVARGRYRARFVEIASPPYTALPPREVVRRYAAALEAEVRAHPSDWLWSHRRWKLKKPLYGR